jgi:fucose permease
VTAASALTRPTRDRPTWIAYVQLAVWAWFLYAFGATQALLRDEQDTSRGLASLHGTLMALGGLAAALVTARLIDRVGRGRTMRWAAAATAVAITVYLLPGAPPAVTLAGALLTAFGTFLIISINGFLLDYQEDAGPASLTEANALASFAGLLGPLAVGLGAATVLGWRAGVWVVVIALVLTELWRGRDVTVFGTVALARREDAPGRLPVRILWPLVAIMCFLGAEFSLTFWGADLLRERCGFGAAAAAASLGAVSGGMLIGRFVGSRLAQRMDVERLLAGSIVLALLAFAIAWSFTWWPAVMTGLLLTGVGIGVHWPLGVARAVRASGGMTDRAAAAASIAGSIAIAATTVLLGVLADAVGVHLAFLAVPTLLAIALAVVLARPVRD